MYSIGKMAKLQTTRRRSLSALLFHSKKEVKRCSSETGILKHDNDENPKPNMRRNVSFNSVEVHEFEMELGDNPSAMGVPVQIGWEPHTSDTYNIDQYEREKPEPRHQADLVLPREVRKQLVKDKGTPKKEIKLVLREMKQIKMDLAASRESMKYDDWEYAKELLGLSKQKILSRTRSKSL